MIIQLQLLRLLHSVLVTKLFAVNSLSEILPRDSLLRSLLFYFVFFIPTFDRLFIPKHVCL